MINQLSKTLGSALERGLGTGENYSAIYAYALEIIFGSLIKLAVIVTVSILIGSFKTTMICLVVFASIRHFGGGVHLSTYPRCLTIGSTIIICLGKLSQYNASIVILLIFFILTLLFGGYTIYKWIPAGTEKKRVTSSDIKIMLKKRTSLVLAFWSVVIVGLLQSNLNNWVPAIELGIFWAMFLTTPVGYRVFGAIDDLINDLKEGRKQQWEKGS